MTYFNPSYNQGFGQPSAPPFYSVPQYENNYTTFIDSKTEWVMQANLPHETATHIFASWIGSLFSSAKVYDPFNPDPILRAKLLKQSGELFYAQYFPNNTNHLKACERKTDAVFQEFISCFSEDEKSPLLCFKASINFNFDDPETHFDLAKNLFLDGLYSKAIEEFEQAFHLSDKLEDSSDYRKQCFKALMQKCSAACYERLGMHDKALLNYMDASKIDPNGRNLNLEEALSRNFEILKSKLVKSFSEIQACIEYAPTDPDFRIDLAHILITQGKLEEALPIVTKTIELSFKHKVASMYRCAELVNRFAAVVQAPPPYQP